MSLKLSFFSSFLAQEGYSSHVLAEEHVACISFVVDTPILCAELYVFLSIHLTNLLLCDHSTIRCLVLCLLVLATGVLVVCLLNSLLCLGYDAFDLPVRLFIVGYSVLLTDKLVYLVICATSATIFPVASNQIIW